MMTTMTRHAPPELQRELGLGLASLRDSENPTGHGLAAVTADLATGEVLAVCVCALMGAGLDRDGAVADLRLAHVELGE